MWASDIPFPHWKQYQSWGIVSIHNKYTSARAAILCGDADVNDSHPMIHYSFGRNAAHGQCSGMVTKDPFTKVLTQRTFLCSAVAPNSCRAEKETKVSIVDTWRGTIDHPKVAFPRQEQRWTTTKGLACIYTWVLCCHFVRKDNAEGSTDVKGTSYFGHANQSLQMYLQYSIVQTKNWGEENNLIVLSSEG